MPRIRSKVEERRAARSPAASHAAPPPFVTPKINADTVHASMPRRRTPANAAAVRLMPADCQDAAISDAPPPAIPPPMSSSRVTPRNAPPADADDTSAEGMPPRPARRRRQSADSASEPHSCQPCQPPPLRCRRRRASQAASRCVAENIDTAARVYATSAPASAPTPPRRHRCRLRAPTRCRSAARRCYSPAASRYREVAAMLRCTRAEAPPPRQPSRRYAATFRADRRLIHAAPLAAVRPARQARRTKAATYKAPREAALRH